MAAVSNAARVVALAAACGALWSAAPAQAGTVQVSFTDPDRFIDAGDRGRDRDDNLRELSRYLQQLGAHGLPPDQTLQIEVTDVDLAGRTWPGSRYDLRIASGGADWPRISLRYVLTSQGSTLASGEEALSDLDYLQRGVGLQPADPLRYEKRMLSDWFDGRFGPHRSAQR